MVGSWGKEVLLSPLRNEFVSPASSPCGPFFLRRCRPTTIPWKCGKCGPRRCLDKMQKYCHKFFIISRDFKAPPRKTFLNPFPMALSSRQLTAVFLVLFAGVFHGGSSFVVHTGTVPKILNG